MKRILFFALSTFLLNSCTKKDTLHFSDVNSPDEMKYKIEVSNNRVISYAFYVNDLLLTTTEFIFNATEAEQITRNSNGSISHRMIYTLGNNGYATSGIDSVFSSAAPSVTTIQYSYIGNRLHSKDVEWRQAGIHPDSSGYTMILESESGNCISTKTVPAGYTGCTDYYSYTTLPNKLDIDDFSNRLTGEINTNLVKHISQHPDCHTGSSTTTPFSDIAYVLDENGYVVKKIETLTPESQTGDVEVVRTVRTTYYEYVFH